MNSREEIGQRIREMRKMKNISQKDLAKMTGITQANMNRIENGRYSPGLDILARIADALEYDLFHQSSE